MAHRYAIVTTEGTSIVYEAKALDAAYLPEGFIDDSRAWFEAITREKLEAALEDIDETERATMVDYATRFNMAYFSGTYRSNDPAWQTDPACTLWRSHGDNLLGQYMNTMMNEPTGNNLSFSLP